MEGLVSLIEYIEGHLSWRNTAMLIGGAACFACGYYFSDCQRMRKESDLVKDFTKEIRMYSDSATQAKIDRSRMETDKAILLWTYQKKIDSLELIIKEYRDENRQE